MPNEVNRHPSLASKKVAAKGEDYVLRPLDGDNIAVDLFMNGQPCGRWSRVFRMSEISEAERHARAKMYELRPYAFIR